MLKLLIARHGNTFDKGDVIRRVGLQTDLDLSNSGKAQSLKLAEHLAQSYPAIEQIFCSELKRTAQTAEIILAQQFQTGSKTIKVAPELNEIDYGIDDGKAESEVIKRIGIDALKAWDEHAIAPEGWLFDKQKCQAELVQLTNNLITNYANKTILLVSSNGITRFFPELLNDLEDFKNKYKLKMSTASLSEFVFDQNIWSCRSWSVKPTLLNT